MGWIESGIKRIKHKPISAMRFLRGQKKKEKERKKNERISSYIHLQLNFTIRFLRETGCKKKEVKEENGFLV